MSHYEPTTVNLPRCPYCGMTTSPPHGPAGCSTVEEVEFYNDGTVKRVKKRTWPSTVADGTKGMERGR